MYQKILELKKEGTLDAFVKAGLLNAKVYTYLEIYMYVNAKMTVNPNNKKTKVVNDCAQIMEVSIETVWRALRCMEITINSTVK